MLPPFNDGKETGFFLPPICQTCWVC